MPLADRIAQLETDLVTQRAKVSEELARLRGIEAELGALRAGMTRGGDLSEMRRTDAILTVLRQASGTMSPSDLVSALHAGGRTDQMRSVTATLDHLLKAGSAQRPSPGRYLAA